MTGCGGEPPGLRNKPNCRKQKFHQMVTSDRADRKRRGSPGSAGEWRDEKSEGRLGFGRCPIWIAHCVNIPHEGPVGDLLRRIEARSVFRGRVAGLNGCYLVVG